MLAVVAPVLQEYELPPLAFRVTEVPVLEQIEISAPALIAAAVFTNIITVSKPLQVSLEVATMYVVVRTGLATGFASVELFNPAVGDHW